MLFKPNNAESLPLVISNIQNCVVDIKSWMTANMLQLNMDKTEVLVLMNKSLRNPTTMNKIKIDSIDISTASSVRNLGGVFDSALSSEAFVNPICKSAWCNLFNISRSRRSLTTDAAKILIQAYVISKIDYCNSLLYGIPDKLLNRIQRIQNYAARVVLRLHKFSHITPALATLLWLPVKRRVDFKIALLVYKALNGQAPAYITDLLQPYDPPRKLRSADKQSNSFHSRPVVWNHMVTVHSAVQPQLYGTISLTVWRLPRLLMILKWNWRPIFIVSHLHNDMWLLFNRDIHWLTLRLEQP